VKFTKEEISLCRQVAEREKKEINGGDWVITTIGRKEVIELVISQRKDSLYTIRTETIYGAVKNREELIPLWTISDCLEFLRDRALYLLGLNQSDECEFVCGFCEVDDMGMRTIDETAKWVEGTTPLEACLKAILAVLEEA